MVVMAETAGLTADRGGTSSERRRTANRLLAVPGSLSGWGTDATAGAADTRNLWAGTTSAPQAMFGGNPSDGGGGMARRSLRSTRLVSPLIQITRIETSDDRELSDLPRRIPDAITCWF